MVIKKKELHAVCPQYLSDFDHSLNGSVIYHKITQIPSKCFYGFSYFLPAYGRAATSILQAFCTDARLRIVYKYLVRSVITTKSCTPKFRGRCNIENTSIQ